MANWYGNSRSNYVKVKDVDVAIAALEPFNTDIRLHPTKGGYMAFFGNDDDGSFNMTNFDTDEELDWREWAKNNLCDGQVLVIQSVGAEKLRYLTGWSAAFTWDGRETRVDISSTLDDQMQSLGINPGEVAEPTYMNTYPPEHEVD